MVSCGSVVVLPSVHPSRKSNVSDSDVIASNVRIGVNSFLSYPTDWDSSGCICQEVHYDIHTHSCPSGRADVVKERLALQVLDDSYILLEGSDLFLER